MRGCQKRLFWAAWEHTLLFTLEPSHSEPGSPAGVLVLEELEHAQARGAPILAEFLGGSCTCDAHHMTEPQPQGRGVRLCIEKCAPDLASKEPSSPVMMVLGQL